MNNENRNFVKEFQDGIISLEEAILTCNNLLVTADRFDKTTTEEIEYLGEQIDRLNELCAEQYMQNKGYVVDKSGIYKKVDKPIDYSDLDEF